MAFIQHKGKLSTDISIIADAVNLHKLQLTEALGNRTISFTSKIKGQGTSLNDIIGNLDVNNFAMTGEGQNISLNKLSIKTHNGLLGKSLDAQTDFGELHLAGLYDYAQIPESVRAYLGTLSPNFFHTPSRFNAITGRANYAFALRLARHQDYQSVA